MNDHKPMLFGICETWFNECSPLHLFEIDGYHLISSSRIDKRGGGLAMWIRYDVKYRRLDYDVIASGSTYEQIAVKTNKNVILLFYNPPTSNFAIVKDYWDQILFSECSSTIEPIFIGDVNCDVNSAIVKQFLNSRNLMNFQLEPTREDRTLDICVSYSNSGIVGGVVNEMCFSDHRAIFVKLLDLNCKRRQIVETITLRDNRNFDFECFNQQLQIIDWNDFEMKIEEEDVDGANETFCREVLNCYHAIAPLITIKKGKHDRLPPEIVAWIRERNRLLKMTRKFPDNRHLKDDFRNIRNFVTSLLKEYRSQKYDHMTTKIHDGKKGSWKFLNNLLGRSHQKEKCEVTAEELNEFFVRPKSWSIVDRSPCIECDNSVDVCSLRTLSVDCVFKCLARLRTKASPGIDMITGKHLKLGKHLLVPKLCKLFNKIITTGKIPIDWKKGKIIPIYKGKGDKKDPSNYRPITLLSCVSKLFELCVYDQLYLNIDSKLPEFQHGFRRKHSIVTANFEISDFIYTAMDNEKVSLLVQLDIAKAYDTVNPKLLLQKIIDEIHPDESLRFLLRNFLFDREVSTFANGIMSASRVVEIGIPQGGVLPPLLFAFFLCDLKLLELRGKAVMYADDIQLLYSFNAHDCSQIEGIIRNDLRLIEELFTSLQMKLNQQKTTVTKFGTRQQLNKLQQTELLINDDIRVDIRGDTRSLGLFLDQNMTFSVHFEKLARCCSLLLYNIRTIRPYIRFEVAKLLVECFVISRIRIFCSITGTAAKKDLASVQKIINIATRVVYNLRKFDHISSFCDRVPWGDIKRLSDSCFGVIVSRTLTGNSSAYLNSLLQRSTDGRLRKKHFMNDKSRTNLGQRRFKHRATTSLNRSM